MFLWNMLGALILIPALSYFLLRGPSLNRRAAPAEPGGQNSDSDNSNKSGIPHALTMSE
ncbi:hypothetical protein D3C78_1993470 [compost metagenome]